MLTALPLLALVAANVGLSDGELADALKGEVPAHTESFVAAGCKSAGRGLGAVVIDRSVAEVWSTLTRYDDDFKVQPMLAERRHRQKHVRRIAEHRGE